MRPEYSSEELDERCDGIVCDFLRWRYGKVEFPLHTDDLKSLLERDAQVVDFSSELMKKKSMVDGSTEFRRGHKPSVRIAARLAHTPGFENQLRLTLAHEYGHVRFHDFLFQTEEGSRLSLFEDLPEPRPRVHRCRRDCMMLLQDDDWMEWQAGFVCGAILMPVSALIELVRRFRHARDLDHAALSERSLDGVALIREVAATFQTSLEAARVRLAQQRIVAPGDMRSLF